MGANRRLRELDRIILGSSKPTTPEEVRRQYARGTRIYIGGLVFAFAVAALALTLSHHWGRIDTVTVPIFALIFVGPQLYLRWKWRPERPPPEG